MKHLNISKEVIDKAKRDLSIIFYEDCCISTDRIIDTFLSILDDELLKETKNYSIPEENYTYIYKEDK